MGEYAKYRKLEIKIGTCEDMLYLRWDQRHQVEPLAGNVDPVKEINSIWFRLPRVLESTVEPGDFEFYGFNGARPIPIYIHPGTQLEDEVDFQRLPQYMEKMEQEAENEFPALK